jgi:hypothetical protein
MYSVHEPSVDCISKGKAHRRHEFGSKVSVATTSEGERAIYGQTLFSYSYLKISEIGYDKMSFLDQCSKENIHNRNIDISTYAWDAEHVLLVGELKEQRYVGFINHFDERVDPGIYHHMKIELLIYTKTMTIKDVAVSLPRVPRDDCPTMVTSLDHIKGMDITRGFSAKIRKMVGGNKGCVHLNTLLIAMAPAAAQGSWINTSWQQKEAGQPDTEISNHLVDSCWAWRKNGPLVAALTKRLANILIRKKQHAEGKMNP